MPRDAGARLVFVLLWAGDGADGDRRRGGRGRLVCGVERAARSGAGGTRLRLPPCCRVQRLRAAAPPLDDVSLHGLLLAYVDAVWLA